MKDYCSHSWTFYDRVTCFQNLRMSTFRRSLRFVVVGILVATIVSLLHVLMKEMKRPKKPILKETRTEELPCVNRTPHISTTTQGTRQVEHREELLLAVLVMSNPRIYNTRRVIRRTWASDVPEGIVVRFVIGTANLTDSELAAVLKEEFDHGDLVLLPRLEDAYNKLAFKLLKMLVWANKNLNIRYLMKVDEDSYVQVKPLAVELLKMPSKRLYWGYFTSESAVMKEGQWADLEYNMCDMYTPYALGGGYVLSADLVNYVAQNHALLKVYKNEDVSLGSWLSPLDIHREHDRRFDTERRSRGCTNSYLVTHKHSSRQIQKYYRTLLKTGKLCVKENMRVRPYMYDWTVPPSDCCYWYPV